jgi:hypothetical protein
MLEDQLHFITCQNNPNHSKSLEVLTTGGSHSATTIHSLTPFPSV